MAVPNIRRSDDEVARLGKALIEKHVTPIARQEDVGKFVAIDVDSGAFEIDADDYTAVTKMRARHPSAELWLGRIGFPTAYLMRLHRWSRESSGPIVRR